MTLAVNKEFGIPQRFQRGNDLEENKSKADAWASGRVVREEAESFGYNSIVGKETVRKERSESGVIAPTRGVEAADAAS